MDSFRWLGRRCFDMISTKRCVGVCATFCAVASVYLGLRTFKKRRNGRIKDKEGDVITVTSHSLEHKPEKSMPKNRNRETVFFLGDIKEYKEGYQKTQQLVCSDFAPVPFLTHNGIPLTRNYINDKDGDVTTVTSDSLKHKSETSMPKNEDRETVPFQSDIKQYREGYEVKSDDSMLRENAKFYLNERKYQPDNVTVEEILKTWKGNYDMLEWKHGYIQWLFPIRDSGVNPEAYELTIRDAQEIKGNDEARERVKRAYELMLDFYGLQLLNSSTGELAKSENWKSRFENLNRNSHNNLRITRILTSLGELGYEHYKVHLVTLLLNESTEGGNLPRCTDSCYNYWLHTLCNEEDLGSVLSEAVLLQDIMSNAIVETSDTFPNRRCEYRFWVHALGVLESQESSERFVKEVQIALQQKQRFLYSKQWRTIFGEESKINGYKDAIISITRNVTADIEVDDRKALIKNIEAVMVYCGIDVTRHDTTDNASQMHLLWRELLKNAKGP